LENYIKVQHVRKG